MVLSLIQWGMPAARVMALAVVVSLVTEAVCQTLMKQKLSQDNGTAAITGLLLAFMLARFRPVVARGHCRGVRHGHSRMAFGGYGDNQVNATLVGWALVFVSFPLYMDPTALGAAQPRSSIPCSRPSTSAARPWRTSRLPTCCSAGSSAVSEPRSPARSFSAACIWPCAGVIRWEVPFSFLIGVFFFRIRAALWPTRP